MGKLKGMKTLVLPIEILIIMIGAIVVAIMGFKFGAIYQSHKRIEISIDKEYSVEDVTNIVKEVLPDEKVIKQDVENFDKDIAFIVKNISKEQIKSLQEKINEKYELKDAKDTVSVVSVPHTKLSDIMKPYVKPLVISTIIIFIYLMIRFRKLGIANIALLTSLTTIRSQALYFSILAICRIPISKLTMPISLLIYIIIVSLIAIKLGVMEKKVNQ